MDCGLTSSGPAALSRLPVRFTLIGPCTAHILQLFNGCFSKTAARELTCALMYTHTFLLQVAGVQTKWHSSGTSGTFVMRISLVLEILPYDH